MAAAVTAGATVEIHAIQAGQVHLLEPMIFKDGKEGTSTPPLPVYCFYLRHAPSGTEMMFDLGLMQDLDAYPPFITSKFPTIFKPSIEADAAQVLARHGVSAEQITEIVLSHPHFDHHGDVARFPNARITYGPGTQAYARPAYPINPQSRFLEDSFPSERTRELTASDFAPCSYAAPYPEAYDIFGDGSVLLLNAPGHMPGHLVALCRTASGPVVLAGDSCHHLCHLTEYAANGRMAYYMHSDHEAARTNLERLDVLRKQGVRVCLAHAGELSEWELITGSNAQE